MSNYATPKHTIPYKPEYNFPSASHCLQRLYSLSAEFSLMNCVDWISGPYLSLDDDSMETYNLWEDGSCNVSSARSW